ncbi:MAG: PcfJ domain-containing protein [Roseburia sp.]
MEKRKLSAIPRPSATKEMIEVADRLGGMRHIVTADLVDDKKILLLNFFEIKALKNGKTEAAFRTFLSHDDYITQDLKTSKVKWITGSFDRMDNFSLMDYAYNQQEHKSSYRLNVFMRSDEELKIVKYFFREYSRTDDKYSPWVEIHRFQQEVLDKRLAEKHKKETDKIDVVMNPIKDAPKEFFDWVWNTGMSFARYLIYKEVEKGKALCECTHCKKIGIVDRKNIHLRNNEKGICPFCGSRVTIKAKGRMPARTHDERWFAYVDPTKDGFVFRYFKAHQSMRSDRYVDMLINKGRIERYVSEYSRAIYTFPKGKPKCESYEWGVYKQRGNCRWCPDQGKISCMECILYPGNLPQAWEHTPMKYSALEVLSGNMPTVALRYEDAIKKYIEFPKLEWICKMGLNRLAKDIINCRYSGNMVGKVREKGATIYEILGLNKVNTKLLQAVDGDHYELRLLQVAQEIGLQFKPEQLREYYETFTCNTELLKQANRKTTLHKIVKYITKESEKYPIGESGECWRYSYMRYREREDPRIERKRNMAKDWLEYLKWCKELGYDLDDMFIYMPKNFKKVHDRTAKEYQEHMDKKAAAEKKRREREAQKRMEETRRALEEILGENKGVQNAFQVKGKGLLLVVPVSAEDIKAEGAALHHCVGTYVDRVARGETNIFFIRKEKEPDKPYFTMEWRDNDIVQCRGSRNCGMTPEVEAFTKAFKKKMLETIEKDKDKGLRRCG